ncbi:nitronate monooxygenase [Tichowtungia aerotolerans]|uniref:Nitronate monooxygenase n=1 Tax=Tichowtungia aerotolerans TaxID=2697043 RepID=A0A6P1M8P3_9BACT|nr:nitronate monooxygenase [Tichowtungia aerotolerans]
MKTNPPTIIQGGMGAGISNWRLAQAVSQTGQLGVVSGTALGAIISRRLQDGDPDGLIRGALEHFPFPRMAQRVMDIFFIPGGKPTATPYRPCLMHDLSGRREPDELSIVGNFVEVFLARQGHNNPVGINYLEKLQLPHMASIYGALLAGVAVIIMGAGIPLAIPNVLSALTHHAEATYPVHIEGADGKTETFNMVFDPAQFAEDTPLPPLLSRPDFLPIVSSETLASLLLRRIPDGIDGFIVESNLAGGHNAPPRGAATISSKGEPVYGPRDDAKLSAFRDLGLPFWLAGSVGSPDGLKTALREGACGIQAGTVFALCTESGLRPDIRHQLIRLALSGKSPIFTDPLASPTGFPFKVAELDGSLSDARSYDLRQRICDLGFLRQPYRRADGSIGYRCPAEPFASYKAKGGKEADTVGRKCLCNALIANVGMPQQLPDGTDELCLITMGTDLAGIDRFCTDDNIDFSAGDVVRTLLKTEDA